MNAMERFEQWCNNPYFDQATRAELRALAEAGDTKEIEDRFYRDLAFGTGGLRGILGAGSNRMNLYTVRKATQGLANFILKQGTAAKGVAISFDSRHMSPEFAEETALCLNANGIPTYRFDSLRPVPMLSFATRTLGCTAGVMITASHNPPAYNGYKVYWDDGAQVTAPLDKEILDEVNAVTDYATVKTMSHDDAVAAGLYHTIGKEIDDQYMATIQALVLDHDSIAKAAGLKIVYTPLHGTGNLPVRRVLSELGFRNVFVVPEQEKPDGSFPTVKSPNPEDKAAFTLALGYAKEQGADLVLATDPDADRLGVFALDRASGEYKSLTGNMSGVLVCDYLLRRRKELGILPANGAVVSTIVSTNMVRTVTEAFGMKYIDVLTGFKFIGEQMRLFERDHTYSFQFGMEESYGCLVGTHARDKDAVVAVMALCEAAAWCYCQGKTLWDRMQELYQEYGYYREDTVNLTYPGQEGAAKIASILESLRANPLQTVGPCKVLKIRDYLKHTVLDLATGAVTPTDLPESNVLYYELENDAWMCVRPSGTEPKVKVYILANGTTKVECDEKVAKYAAWAETLKG